MLPGIVLALMMESALVPNQHGWAQEPTRRAGVQAHGGRVNAVAFSPNGKIVATAGEDKLVKLWDVGTRKVLAVLIGHDGPVASVSFSPDGRSLASASDDKTVRLWEIATGKERLQCRGHQEEVFCVAFAPDGKTLVSGGGDGQLQIWHTATGKELHNPYAQKNGNGLNEQIHALSYSPDGKLLAAAASNEVFLWDTITGKMRWVLNGGRTVGYAMAFSPDSKALATSYCDVAVWDLATGKPHILEGAEVGVRPLAFSPSGKTLVAAKSRSNRPNNQGTLYLWDMKKGTTWLEFEGHRPTALAFSPNGSGFVSGSADGALIFWDIAESKI